MEPVRVENGIGYVPTGPGLGVEINREILMKYKVN
jgi:L-alanine-DL-glutamate epimerase-like enolase superfamily enzyme